jgi:hypothetical protein
VIVGFKIGIRRFEQLAPGHYDHIDGSLRFIAPEYLTDQTLGPVTAHRIPEFATGHYSQPWAAEIVRQDEHRHEAAVHPKSLGEHALELGPSLEPLGRSECLRPGRSVRARLVASAWRFDH